MARDTSEPCTQRCGYVDEGQDLLDHERYEHVPCPLCDSKPIGVSSVSHEPGCPRLRADHTYEAERAGAYAGFSHKHQGE
jgi:hypothetical protein